MKVKINIWLSLDGQKKNKKNKTFKNIFFYVPKKKKSYKFKTIYGWLNNDRISFLVNYTFNLFKFIEKNKMFYWKYQVLLLAAFPCLRKRLLIRFIYVNCVLEPSVIPIINALPSQLCSPQKAE